MSNHKAFFENGSSRSERRPAYHLVAPEAVQAIAERMGQGWEVHGEENWKKGGPNFFAETRNHLEHHWQMLKAGDASDDHLAAVATNAMMLLWWERAGKTAWEAREIARCEAELARIHSTQVCLAQGEADWEAEKRHICAGKSRK